MTRTDLIVIGASARAAAFSAARAGYSPWWIDQYGDADLRGAFPGRQVPPRDYPRELVTAMESAPDAPWLYTGALENHLDVLDRLAAARPLLGNGRTVCERVRSPWRLQSCLRAAGIPFPETPPFDSAPPADGDWIVKPLRGAGGLGIRPLQPREGPGTGWFVQRRLPGESRSAVFLGNGRGAILLGVTRQLVGRGEFHAGEFNYCGSIGPVSGTADEQREWRRIGSVLAAEFGLLGIFGVDALRTPAGITPVEVNPRYTASVEVIEQALDVAAIRLHVDACAGTLLDRVADPGGARVGKAYLFAPRDLQVPNLRAGDGDEFAGGNTRIADIPAVGALIAAGAPVLTVMVRADSAEQCADLLSAAASKIYTRLGA